MINDGLNWIQARVSPELCRNATRRKNSARVPVSFLLIFVCQPCKEKNICAHTVTDGFLERAPCEEILSKDGSGNWNVCEKKAIHQACSTLSILTHVMETSKLVTTCPCTNMSVGAAIFEMFFAETAGTGQTQRVSPKKQKMNSGKMMWKQD